MIQLSDLPSHIPNDIKLIIQKIVAANIIQKKAKINFEKRFGINWKDILNYRWTVEDLDYYCERKGIMDPWYDYCDDPRYDYDKSDDDIRSFFDSCGTIQ